MSTPTVLLSHHNGPREGVPYPIPIQQSKIREAQRKIETKEFNEWSCSAYSATLVSLILSDFFSPESTPEMHPKGPQNT